MIKKILLILAAIFLTYQSYILVTRIHNFQAESWIALFFIAWIINLFITGIFAFSGFALPTQKLLPESFYTVRNPSALKKIYQSLNVDFFRTFLLATVWRNKEMRKGYFNGKKTGISNLITQSKKSEFGHFLPFVIINGVAIYFFMIGHYTLAIFTLAFNFIGNFYPVLLQRHHRMRIQRLQKIKQARSIK